MTPSKQRSKLLRGPVRLLLVFSFSMGPADNYWRLKCWISSHSLSDSLLQYRWVERLLPLPGDRTFLCHGLFGRSSWLDESPEWLAACWFIKHVRSWSGSKLQGDAMGVVIRYRQENGGLSRNVVDEDAMTHSHSSCATEWPWLVGVHRQQLC